MGYLRIEYLRTLGQLEKIPNMYMMGILGEELKEQKKYLK